MLCGVFIAISTSQWISNFVSQRDFKKDRRSIAGFSVFAGFQPPKVITIWAYWIVNIPKENTNGCVGTYFGTLSLAYGDGYQKFDPAELIAFITSCIAFKSIWYSVFNNVVLFCKNDANKQNSTKQTNIILIVEL